MPDIAAHTQQCRIDKYCSKDATISNLQTTKCFQLEHCMTCTWYKSHTRYTLRTCRLLNQCTRNASLSKVEKQQCTLTMPVLADTTTCNCSNCKLQATTAHGQSHKCTTGMLSTSLQDLTGTAEATASCSCFVMRLCKQINNSSFLQLALTSAVGISQSSHEPPFAALAANSGHCFLK